MKAARLIRQGQPLELVNIEIPAPGPGELLLKLEACGVCHTDLHIRDGDEEVTDDTLPLTLGHEGIGTVAALGPGVDRFSIGERLGAPWLHDTCQRCRDCLTGHESICADQRAHGMQVNGAFAEYIIVRADFTVPIPDGMDPLRAAPLLCAGVTAYGAILKAALKPGETCAIFGCGGLGQYAVQLARISGARVIAIDTSAQRLNEARRMGASETLLSNGETGERLRDLGGADACINFAPTAAIWPAVEAGLNNRGRFVSVAMPHEPAALSLVWLTWINPVITGTSVGGRQELKDLLALAQMHDLSIDTETIKLADVNTALDRLKGCDGTEPVRGRMVIDYRTG